MIPEIQDTGVSRSLRDNRHGKHGLKCAILCLGITAWTPAMGIPVTVEFAGTINPTPTSPSGPPIGSSFSGALTYESDTPAFLTGPVDYIYTSALSSFQLVTSIGTFSGDSVGNNIVLRNDLCLPPTRLVCRDSFAANGELSEPTALYDSGRFQFLLSDSELLSMGAPSLLSEASSLPTSLNLAGLDFGQVFMLWDGERAGSFRGAITSVEVTSVPEPGTGWLMLSGLIGLLAARRARTGKQ